MHEQLAKTGEQIGDGVGDKHQAEDARPPASDGERKRDRQPDEAERADTGEADEEPVEPADALSDDPVLELSIDAKQGRVAWRARSTGADRTASR